SWPFWLGPQQVFDPGELSLGPQELELVVLPLQDEERPADREAALVPEEVAEHGLDGLGLGARGEPVAQLLVVGRADRADGLLHALADGERDGLVLVGLALEFGLEVLDELLIAVLVAGEEALIGRGGVPRGVGDDAVGGVPERLLELGLRAL